MGTTDHERSSKSIPSKSFFNVLFSGGEISIKLLFLNIKFEITSAINPEFDIFRKLIAIVKDNYKVYLELNLELSVYECRARIDFREKHIKRYF